jgi:glyoxylase-like metal-dependent hydrolase (beta-lactamase superfamily II)
MRLQVRGVDHDPLRLSKIGDFQATMISDGQGPIPVSPIFVMNASEAELAPVLRANFMQPVIQATNNPLVVDTGRERILVDTRFGEKIGPPFGSFPWLQANLGRAGIAPESIDLVVVSHGHLDDIGGLVSESGARVSKGSVRLRRYGVELLDQQPF